VLDEVLLRIKNMTPREIGFLTLSPLHALRERVKAGLESKGSVIGFQVMAFSTVTCKQYEALERVHGIYSWEENYKLK